MLPVHHIHAGEFDHPSAEAQQHGDGDNVKSSTSHDVHFLKLLSNDSFNSLYRQGDVPLVAHLSGAEPPEPIALHVRAIALERAVASVARVGDAHALFCVFLI